MANEEFPSFDSFLCNGHLDDEYYDYIYIVTLKDETPVCIKFHSLHIDSNFLKSTREWDADSDFYTNRNIKVKKVSHNVSNDDEMISVLKEIPGTFGVWGQKQFDYFNRFLDNVVDVEPFLKKEAFRPGPKGSIENVNVRELVLEILRERMERSWQENAKVCFRRFLVNFRMEQPEKPRHLRLRDVQCFVFFDAEFFLDDVSIHIATTDRKTPVCLKVHEIYGYDLNGDKEMDMIDEIDTRKRTVTPFQWTMKIQISSRFVECRAQLEWILKDMNKIVGVWGKEQFDYFSEFLDNVVDVAPFIAEELSSFDLNAEIKNPKDHSMSIWELFLEMLRNLAKETENFSDESVRGEFMDWITDKGWKAFFRREDNFSSNSSHSSGVECLE